MDLKTQINKNGRVIIPARLRKALDLQPGDDIVMRLENNSIRMIPLRQAVELAQKKVRRYIPEGTSLVDELFMARKEEAAKLKESRK
ncbi:MAG: AbrB/MazE/SpoVT family DNA-binding domain-containing protein [Chloroflexi bacterium]|nr:MAG: AbrB/MazE/SpoVT family DNA-binding domain-containing protein [Chloroflexota bacterium]